MGRVLGLIGKYEDLKQQGGESVQFWVDETLSAATATHEVRCVDPHFGLTSMSQHAVMILAWIRETTLAKEQTISEKS